MNERSVLAKQKAKEKEIEDFALDEISSNFQIPGFLDYADFLNRLEEEVYRGLQTRSKMTLLLIEIHHFQLIKHDYGSEQTKLILHKVADIISDLLRESEIKAYLGEGVYAVILPGAELIRASMIEIQLDDKFNSLLMPRSRRESTINVSMKYGKAESPTKGTEAHVIFGKAKKDLEGMEMSGS
ncbi:response regulator PleD [compost metagenome]